MNNNEKITLESLSQGINNVQEPIYQKSQFPISYEILNAIGSLGNLIGQNNGLLLANVQEIVNKNEVLSRKRRRIRTGEQLLVPEDKPLFLQCCYDDGTNDTIQLTSNLTGKFRVFNLDFGGREKTEKFGIYFENEVIWIIGDKKKVKGQYLYDCFIRSGVNFNSAIPERRISTALYRFWCPKIEQEGTTLSISVMAGWDRGTFYYKDNYLFRKTTDFPDIPVFKKEFPSVTFTEKMRKLYFEEIGRIINWRARFLIAVIPFIGLTSTLLREGNAPLRQGVNFVLLEAFDKNQIPAWLQIFNRRNLECINLDKNDSEIKRILQDAKEEVLIFDATTHPEDTDYKRKKLAQNVAKIIDTITGNRNSYDIKSCLNNNVVAFISQDRILNKNVLNLMVDSDFLGITDMKQEFLDCQVMEAVFSGIVSFIQENMNMVQQIIRRNRESKGTLSEVFDIVFDILNLYWKGEGINMEKELNLPEGWKIEEVSKNEFSEETDLREAMIAAVRKGISEFYIMEKKYGTDYKERTIYYDSQFLYFPTKVLKQIAKKDGLYSYFFEILLSLRNYGEMKVDAEGISRKLQVGDRRFEVYQIKRELFNKRGNIDIVLLGKEDSEIER